MKITKERVIALIKKIDEMTAVEATKYKETVKASNWNVALKEKILDIIDYKIDPIQKSKILEVVHAKWDLD